LRKYPRHNKGNREEKKKENGLSLEKKGKNPRWGGSFKKKKK